MTPPVVGRDPVEAAWAAGLFEGEGSIGSTPGRRPDSRRGLRLQLSSTDEDVVRKFADVARCGQVAGPYVPRPHQNKAVWKWSGSGPAARALLVDLEPFLSERRSDRLREVCRLCRIS